MQFFTFPIVAVLAAGSLAMPNSLESRNSESHSLEAPVDCGQILPACNGGSISGQTDCRCSGQIASCDVWNCPGHDVVGHPFSVPRLRLHVHTYHHHLLPVSSLFFQKLKRRIHVNHALCTDGMWPGRKWMRVDLGASTHFFFKVNGGLSVGSVKRSQHHERPFMESPIENVCEKLR